MAWPFGGVAIQFLLAAAFASSVASNRYTTDCASPVTVPAGQSSVTFTVTATPNTDPNDGNGTVTLTLQPGTGYSVPAGTAPAVVAVNNDDFSTTMAVPTLAVWLLGVLAALLGGLGLRAQRRA